MSFGAITKSLPTKGNIKWEYNPLLNFRLNKPRWRIYSDHIEKWYYSAEDLESSGYVEYNNDKYELKSDYSNYTLESFEKNQVVDLDTETFDFNTQNPVEILPLYSYDGSVNLILNDGNALPRMINTRFSTTGLNTYEIIDRLGNNDTNLYDEGEQFNIDTSLFKIIDKIPNIEFLGVLNGGNMRVGNYHFYFKLCDADGNETDFVGQSGLVSVFIGNPGPSAHTGMRDLNSCKLVKFKLSDIDTSYDKVIVYYSRSSAEGMENYHTQYKKILLKFSITALGTSYINITGYENVQDVSYREINTQFYTADAVKTQTSVNNRLFLGNIHKTTIPYKELLDLALRFIPYLNKKKWDFDINYNYAVKSNNSGYYSPIKIYNEVGYWPDEYYRFGIVFILKTGELSPVFNVRGALNITENSIFSDIPLTDKKNNQESRQYINFNKDTFLLENNTVPTKENIKVSENIESDENSKDKVIYENAAGVVSYKIDNSLNNIIGIKFTTEKEVLTELYRYCKGFFFVRQRRIPNILALGISIGIENNSHTPVIPTEAGVLDKVINGLGTYHHVKYHTKLKKHYVTEGFLKRYKFKLSSSLGRLFKKFASILEGTITAYASVVTLGSTSSAISLAKKAGSTLNLDSANGWNITTVSGFKHEEASESRQVGGSFTDRLIIKTVDQCANTGIICPEYTLNLAYFNSIFTGNEHYLQEVNTNNAGDYFDNEGRHFYISTYSSQDVSNYYTAKIIGVGEDVKLVGFDNYKFKARAGDAAEAWKYECVGTEYKGGEKGKQRNTDIVRGVFSPYLGVGTKDLPSAKLFNIYKPGYNPLDYDNSLSVRTHDNSPYYAISERYTINYEQEDINSNVYTLYKKEDIKTEWNVYSGDSYICLYTLRIIRNFNDPSALYNDEIVDVNTWRDNYDPEKPESYSKINTGDVNAVELGMWVTFKLRSNYNLNIRTIDESNSEEKAMSGHGRGYYPKFPMMTSGNYKKPESLVYNKGFSVSVGSKTFFNLPEVPYIKDWFGTRIMYSNISVSDNFLNGFRVFKPTAFRDYTREYGELTKLIPMEGSLIAVMEHGILLLPLNINVTGEDTELTTKNVLPETPTVISDRFGTQWKDSILKTDAGIYGVDTSAKKIWRFTASKGLELLSENKILEFLNQNLILMENLKTPIIGRVNVKTLYNAFKKDVMFTFYNISNTKNEVPTDDEVTWNICFSELTGTFTSFYSWIPSFMENIDNIPFSFDRDMSKTLSLTDDYYNIFKISRPFYKPDDISDPVFKDLELTSNQIGKLYASDGTNITFELGKDRENNAKYFEIDNNILTIKNTDVIDILSKKPIRLLIKAEIKGVSYHQFIYIMSYKYFSDLRVAFWKHGQAGIIDIEGENYEKKNPNTIRPTHWYGKQHPFEIEFVVNDKPQLHKIFDNLEIISNSAEPESFHYEVVGDLYDFAYDKKNMYIRQEATKKLYYDNGADISYNTKYEKMEEKHFKMCDMYGRPVQGLYKKSTILPLYYSRLDILNDVIDNYQIKDGKEEYKDYSALTGGEIVYYQTLDEYRIWNHAKAVDITDLSKGRLRGNMHYKESTWQVLINPINYIESNEGEWYNNKVPVIINYDTIPQLVKDTVTYEQNGVFTWNGDRTVMTWPSNKIRALEAKPKDKWMKVRIRYTGDKLAIISAIRTMYSISMA